MIFPWGRLKPKATLAAGLHDKEVLGSQEEEGSAMNM